MKNITRSFVALALAAFGVAGASAQTLTLSTYTGTDITSYDSKVVTVRANRYMFHGWNTISLPFALSAEQVCSIFGDDCKLEELVGVENDGSNVCLNFQDCKSKGIQPNRPYILHYAGETGSKTIAVPGVKVVKGNESVTYSDNRGVNVTFSAAQKKTDADGLYGILARDNGEATFVNVDNVETGFYATRCFVQLSNGNSNLLTTNHIGEGDATSVNNIVKRGERVDVYNLSGLLVSQSLTAAEIEGLAKGIYVVKGKKIAVR